jgi:SAM-dependent methyltransferase
MESKPTGADRSDEPIKPVARLREMIMGFRMTQLLYVAAKLNLADQLATAPQSAHQLAHTVGADASSLRRLLRALAGAGLVVETNGTFELTAVGELLRRDRPGSLHAVAALYGEEWLWRAYGRMLHSVQTGEPAFTHVHGLSFYDYLSHDPTAAAQFQHAMSEYSRLEADAIAAAYDFSGHSTVVDIGGGKGTLLAKLLSAHGGLSGVLFDLPEVVLGADHVFTLAGVSSRASWVGGDFFSAVPHDGDLYLLKSVLHNWDDEAAARLLQCCHRAMGPHARLLVAERVVPADNAPSEAKLFDINMLVVVGGRERTEAEYRELFKRSGFALARVIPTNSPLSLIEAQPVSAEQSRG